MWITIGIVTFILLIGGLFFFLNYSADDNSLTILEKKWITDHTNQIEDVYVYNDDPEKITHYSKWTSIVELWNEDLIKISNEEFIAFREKIEKKFKEFNEIV